MTCFLAQGILYHRTDVDAQFGIAYLDKGLHDGGVPMPRQGVVAGAHTRIKAKRHVCIALQGDITAPLEGLTHRQRTTKTRGSITAEHRDPEVGIGMPVDRTIEHRRNEIHRIFVQTHSALQRPVFTQLLVNTHPRMGRISEERTSPSPVVTIHHSRRPLRQPTALRPQLNMHVGHRGSLLLEGWVDRNILRQPRRSVRLQLSRQGRRPDGPRQLLNLLLRQPRTLLARHGVIPLLGTHRHGQYTAEAKSQEKASIHDESKDEMF